MKRYNSFIICVLAGIVFGVGALYPLSWMALVLGWICAGLIVLGSNTSNRLYRDFFAFGVAFHLIAFYWLTHTFSNFGGFPSWISALLLFAFAIISSLQMIFCAFLFKKLSKTPYHDNSLLGALSKWHLLLPLAWGVSEFLFPKMFPWSLSHPQIKWEAFSALGEFLSTSVLSVIMLWITSHVVAIARECSRGNFKRFSIGTAILSTLLILGHTRNEQVRTAMNNSTPLKVGVIQGNLEAKQKGDIHYLEANIDRYQELSEQAVKSGVSLLIWPESIVNTWVYESIENVRDTQADPYPTNTVPLLYGGLSVRLRTEQELEKIFSKPISEIPEYEIRKQRIKKRFNSAIGIDTEGNVIGIYHKQVLMPFGEYIPYVDLIPWLSDISPRTGNFDFGDIKEPIRFDSPKVSVAPLICYEDLVSTPSLDAVDRGADILVNLTNDAWYGDTPASRQHHLLASWRAIETRRFFIRATNTGFSAVVNPLGQTVESLPVFKDTFLATNISPLTMHNYYGTLGRGIPKIMSAIVLCLLCAHIGRFKKQHLKNLNQRQL